MVRFFGRAVIVGTGDPSLADVVRTLWRPFAPADVSTSDSSSDTDVIEVTVPPGGRPVDDLGWLNSALNSTAMEVAPHLAVHAGVVRRGDVVVAFPARSGVGKSTLTGACLREGFDYVSDEALCLSYENNLVHPYPRPLGLSSWSARELAVAGVRAGDDELLVLPHEFGAKASAVDEPLRLTHIVLPQRVADGAASLTPAAAHEAIQALLRMSFNHYRRPADAVRVVASVVAGARVNVLTYSSAVEAAALVAQCFSAHAAEPGRAPAAVSPLVDELPHP
jgi:serine kinase of HPr protein (carbohydrate metabolism regulator)